VNASTIAGVTYELLSEARKHWPGARNHARRWEPGRRSLYDLCAGTSHDDLDATISKLWLIGRSHSAALERTHVGRQGDVYFDAASRLREARLDETLSTLAALPVTYDQPHRDAIALCVANVTNVLMQVTEQEKISLASKYLHYHQRSIPIYDSISDGAFRKLAQRVARGRDVYAGHLERFEDLFVALRAANEFEPVSARTIDDFVLWWWQPD